MITGGFQLHAAVSKVTYPTDDLETCGELFDRIPEPDSLHPVRYSRCVG